MHSWWLRCWCRAIHTANHKFIRGKSLLTNLLQPCQVKNGNTVCLPPFLTRLTWIVLFSGRRNMIFACNRPERENKLTIKFQVVSPSPLGFKFQYCNDYYLVGKYSFILQLVYFCVRHVLYHVCLTACLRFTCSLYLYYTLMFSIFIHIRVFLYSLSSSN